MSEIKFSCPACSQRISCSTDYCDQPVHCPNCRTEIRVPCSANPNLNRETPKLKLQSSVAPQPASVGTSEIGKTVPAVANEKELHCRCPVCESHLRIPKSVAEQTGDVFPSAELVSKPVDSQKPPVAPAGVPILTEREKQIAAERAARDVSLYPKMKPRLDLVLGEKSPAKSKDEDNPNWMKEAA